MGSKSVTKKDYPDIIKRILTEYFQIKIANGKIEQELIFDDAGKHYQLLKMGWIDRIKRVFHPTIHIDIREDKVWIEFDGTEDGVARELVDAGIPKDKIVLAYRTKEMRKYTDYAVE